ncbi:MAG: hypothetical protein J5601_06785 [Elusimicrobiaceae bacterium]|nr:hypothetical protein [Elusimicrobiaceae bacterium]
MTANIQSTVIGNIQILINPESVGAGFSVIARTFDSSGKSATVSKSSNLSINTAYSRFYELICKAERGELI